MGIEKHRRLVMDIDGVLTIKDEDTDYADKPINERVAAQIRGYHDRGFYIILYTARNMNTYDGRVGKIHANTAPTLLQWLDEHDVPYDEIHYGKPWCGHDGFYVDDKAIRPSELVENDYEQILDLLETESNRW